MTRDEIIRLAKLAGIDSQPGWPNTAFLGRFVELVAAEYKKDAERLDFLEKEMNSKIHRVGDRWYWSRARHRTYYCEGGLRDAVDAAMEKVK